MTAQPEVKQELSTTVGVDPAPGLDETVYDLDLMAELDDDQARAHAVLFLQELGDVRAVMARERNELRSTKTLLDGRAAERKRPREREEARLFEALKVLWGRIIAKKGQKSVKTLGGILGEKLTGESIAVTDQPKLFTYLREHGIYKQFVTPKTTEVIDTASLKAELRMRHENALQRLKKTGEVVDLAVPGLEYTPAEDKFYATPD